MQLGPRNSHDTPVVSVKEKRKAETKGLGLQGFFLRPASDDVISALARCKSERDYYS